MGWINRNYDGRKQRHFPCWRWCFSVLGRSNAHRNIPQNLFGDIHLVTTYLRSDFSIPLLTCKRMYTLRVTVSAVGLLKKNSFKHNRTYVLNTMTQMQISTNKTRHHMAKTWKEISAYVHMKRDTPLPLLDDPRPFP